MGLQINSNTTKNMTPELDYKQFVIVHTSLA